MKLELIKHENCPSCGAITVAESCRSRHCNGQGFEERQFACGCVYRWSPNGERLENPSKCPKSPEMVEIKRKQEIALKAIKEFMSSLDVDEDFKRDVTRYLPSKIY